MAKLWRVVVCTMGLLAACAAPAAAAPEITIGPDGTTAPVFDYEQAVRERVFIPQPGIDQDGDGADDWIAIEVIRPLESGPAMQIPAIVDAEPVLHDVLPRQRGRVHRRRRRRRPQRPLAAVLRQLLRAARLRRTCSPR